MKKVETISNYRYIISPIPYKNKEKLASINLSNNSGQCGICGSINDCNCEYCGMMLDCKIDD